MKKGLEGWEGGGEGEGGSGTVGQVTVAADLLGWYTGTSLCMHCIQYAVQEYVSQLIMSVVIINLPHGHGL